MYAFDGGMDPPNCWVTEDQLWVSKTATGVANERDVAVVWRTFYTWAFGVYLALAIFPTVAGTLICIGENVAVGGAVCAGCAGVGVLVKWAIWIWAIVLRTTTEGRVAAGKMIGECEQVNPDLAPELVDSEITNDASTDGIGRLLQEDEPATLTAIMGGKTCDDPAAFQIKGGKLFIAWLIISGIKCF